MSSSTKQLSSFSCARRKTSSSTTELRLVLLGKTGGGKSSTANSILGRKIFDTSVTQRCRRAGGEFRGRQLMLLDTPGLADAHQSPREVQKELRRSVSLLFPGPHAFLIVMQIGRLGQEERDAVRRIKEAMGSALSFSVVVFTHGDRLDGGTTVKECLIDGCGDVAELVGRCGGRYCVFNNQSSRNREQVSELLALVDGVMQANEESCYTSKLLHKAEEDLSHQLQEEAFKRKQEAKREAKTSEMDKLKKKQEFEKEKMEKLARDQEETFRQQMEENDRKEKEEKREILQKKLEKVTKKLEEHVEREVEMRRLMEEKIQKDKAENDRRAREKEFQQIQMEQAVRRREEMKRDALQKDLDKLVQRLEEQSRKQKQTEEMLRREREENQRERYLQTENQRAEKRRTVALQQELKLIKMKIEEQKVTEESLKRRLEDNLRRGREKCDEEMSALKKPCDKKCSDTIAKKPAEKLKTMTTVTGYVQEMGLLGLNVALESIGASCCIQ